MLFQIITSLSQIFQHIYWKKYTYKYACALQTHAIQGSALCGNRKHTNIVDVFPA